MVGFRGHGNTPWGLGLQGTEFTRAPAATWEWKSFFSQAALVKECAVEVQRQACSWEKQDSSGSSLGSPEALLGLPLNCSQWHFHQTFFLPFLSPLRVTFASCSDGSPCLPWMLSHVLSQPASHRPGLTLVITGQNLPTCSLSSFGSSCVMNWEHLNLISQCWQASYLPEINQILGPC